MTASSGNEHDPVDPVGDEPTGATGPRSPHSKHRHSTGRTGQGAHGGDASSEPGGEDEYDVYIPDTPGSLVDNEIEGEVVEEAPAVEVQNDVHPDTRKAAEHLEDLRRLQAEYVNYKKRVDRDRELARDRGVTQVVEALLPVLDDIHAAREHGELEGGPFAAIADKLEAILGRFGVESIGAKGEEFDPVIHEALMHVDAELPEDATTTTVVQVIQPGFKMGERVVRPARVSVADPR
ncbi:MAG TPA: nucleotide exchange factor GrpE [Lapillicoccus sp.]|nr:nucleotide exchange factor GrpE [Lapillicoccus sp.]